jgi:ubiquinone/menaquinone biosynthesis C-methylase UbiE
MHQTLYDSIGRNYNNHRKADVRIISAIKDLLNLPTGSTVADIGAGTGNYSNALANSGYQIIAVEPSDLMRQQAVPNQDVTWLSGNAELIPLSDNSVNGVIIILAFHHFSDAKKAVKELVRICPAGPVVIFTMDPRESEKFWFNDYFPEIARHVVKTFPPVNKIIKLIAAQNRRSAIVKKIPLPGDLEDMNMCSGWNRPEIYLDEKMRENTSGFALASPEYVQKGLVKLQKGLSSGEWDKKYGFLRKLDCFDAGFRFIRFTN